MTGLSKAYLLTPAPRTGMSRQTRKDLQEEMT